MISPDNTAEVADTTNAVLLSEGDGGIALVTLARPATRNALSHAVLEQLHAHLASITDARAMVLTGGDRAFCAGGDLGEVHRALEAGNRDEVEQMLALLNDVVRQIKKLPMPTIAAIEGVAIGAGLSLAMAVDVRIAGRRASFIPGYMAVGASPDGGASYHLSRTLGPQSALAAFVLNRRIDSTELLARGLVDQLVDGGAALTTATAVASHLADISADALLATRTLVDSATSNALDRHLEAESVAFTALWDTPAFRDAVAVYAGDTGEAGDATP